MDKLQYKTEASSAAEFFIEPRGLDDGAVAASRAKHGANIMTRRRKKSFLRRLLTNMGDPVIKILLAALVVNVIFTFRGGD